MTYQLLPFRFTRFPPGQELMTNEAGEFLFASTGTVERIVKRGITAGTDEYKDLLAKHIVVDDETVPLLDVLSTKLRTKKAHLGAGICLQLVVVTRRCNHLCRYCQTSRRPSVDSRYDMPKSTIDNVVDAVIASSADSFTLEIQGGEPLLAMEGVKYLVEKAQRRAQAAKKEMSVVICTNLSLADDAFFAYCKHNEIAVSTSLDGPLDLHNAYRELPGGNSYTLVRDKLTQAISKLGVDRVSALMTTTRQSLRHGKRIVDEYVSLGLTHIFLRRLNAYGFARNADVEMYSSEEFLNFYKECLSYIIQRNKEGQNIVEVYTSILLRKILTPFSTGFVDLLSPPGMGISFMAYDYNGNVYPSDESRMLSATGDETFLLGNLLVDKIDAIVSNPRLKDIHYQAMAEGVPGCADCVFLPYCGSDPVHHYNTQHDMVGTKPSSTFCQINKGIFRFLFEKILGNDPDEMRVFWSWIRNTPIADIEGALPGHD